MIKSLHHRFERAAFALCRFQAHRFKLSIQTDFFMAQIIFIHTREDRTAADFIVRVFARTNVNPVLLECSDETIFFEPGKNFEQTINNASAIFILLTAAMANNKFLRSQVRSVCDYAAGKDVWIFEPATEFGLVAATVKNFKHYARFETHDGWADYTEALIKFYDDAGIVPLLAASAGGGALLADKDKVAGGMVGLVLGLGAWFLNRSNRVEFGQETICRRCARKFQLHLTAGECEFRCAFCGAFCLAKNSAAFNRLTRRGQIKDGAAKNLSSIAPQTNLLMIEHIKTPKAFISYSWDNDEHRDWVRALATRLRGEGVDVTLDQWHLAPGDPLPEFMERGVRENDFVLLVCTPNFKTRADDRKGGVGYEGNIMTGELFLKYNHRKFIPVLRHSDWAEAAPDWLRAKRYIDLTDSRLNQNFEELVRTLHGESLELPPLGTRSGTKSAGEDNAQNSTAPEAAKRKSIKPKRSKRIAPASITAQETDERSWSPIKIIGIAAEEITKPKMDGTRGNGLYAVPFQLSVRPPKEWAQLFVQTWNSPPSFTTMHRPGIAKVSGDKVILDGTTLEEVEKYHHETLLGVLEQVNRDYGEYRVRQEREAQRKREIEARHDENVSDVLKRIKFD